MDTVVNNDLEAKLYNLVSNFKLESIENMLMLMLDDAAKTGGINYIGELNKIDPMF